MPRQMRRRLASSGKGKLDDEREPAHERRIQVLAKIRRQNAQSIVFVHFLQQVSDFDIGVAVVRILNRGPFTEQRVAFVEQEDGVASRASRKSRSRFFSVSPMYLLTTCERSIL